VVGRQQVFFDSQGTAHEEFMKEVCTVNVEYYNGVLDRLISRNRPVHPPCTELVIFLPAQQLPGAFGSKIRQFLTQKLAATLNHTPYTPDLFPTPPLL
jgi:hypothetical protein